LNFTKNKLKRIIFIAFLYLSEIYSAGLGDFPVGIPL
jgi:hypothetical protein